MRDSCCVKCGNEIPKIRLFALPETHHCVRCSTTRAKTVLDIETDGPDGNELVKACTNQGD